MGRHALLLKVVISFSSTLALRPAHAALTAPWTLARTHRRTGPLLLGPDSTQTRRRKGIVATVWADDEEKEKVAAVWRGRRKMARMMFFAQLEVNGGELEEQQQQMHQEDEVEDATKTAIATTAFGVAIVAILVRLGGRAALLELIGLNVGADEEVSRQVDSLLGLKDSLPGGEATAVACYIALWTVGKCLCLDPLVFLLAVSSGVFFGGVVQGATASALCGTVGSAAAFGLARVSELRPKILRLARRNPRLRALERAVSERGFATVLVLRLAPVLPIPIGSYPYVYGATEMKFWQFAPATFLGSLKPYAFDAYLGLVAKDLVDSAAANGANDDLPVVLVFGAFLFVGTLASQLATQTWEEIERAQGKDVAPPDDDLSEDWADVLGIRRTPPWQFAAGISNATKANEPNWSRQLRARSQRAKYALAAMALQEFHNARLLYRNSNESDPDCVNAASELVPIFEKQSPPPGAADDLSGSILESALYAFVLGRALWNNGTLVDEIQAASANGYDYLPTPPAGASS